MAGARPAGRAVVSDALLAAAEHLFGQKGPNAVSLREIAAEADVNFGLLYQYIGTREDLLRMVFDRLSERGSSALAEAPDFASAVHVMRASHSENAYARMIAWSILEGYALDATLDRRPSTAILLAHAQAALAERGCTDERAARAVMAMLLAFHLGWRLFSEHLLTAFDLTSLEDTIGEAVSDVLADLPAQLSFDFPQH